MDPPILEDASDLQLLRQFQESGDGGAFAELVQRHGPMVMSVAHRQLSHESDAEDVFQATFLALARECAQRKVHSNLAGWLFRVAYRSAVKVRHQRHRCVHDQIEECPVEHQDELAGVARQHQLSVLDEELESLPDKYRDPLVRHHLLGHSSRLIATALNLTVACVEGRLRRARKRLRSRLIRRGVTLGAVASAAAIPGKTASAALSPDVVAKTVDACSQFAKGGGYPVARIDQLSYLSETSLGVSSMKTLIATTLVGIVFVSVTGILPNGSIEPRTASGNFRVDAGLTTASIQADTQRAVDQSSVESQIISVDSPADRRSEAATPVVDSDVSSEPVDAQQQPTRQEFSAHAISQAEQSIESAMDTKVELAFSESPLDEVLKYLSDTQKIPILVDTKALEDIGVSPADVGVNLQLESLPLRSALELILEPAGLDYVVKNDVLQITSREHAEETLAVRVYSIDADVISLDPEQLAEIIERTVIPDSWSSQGGSGVIEPLPDGLVITQSQRVHREVNTLLEQLARHGARQ